MKSQLKQILQANNSLKLTVGDSKNVLNDIVADLVSLVSLCNISIGAATACNC